MKKILAITTATALSLGGVAVSVPAFAVGENNPTFGVSSFNAEVGTAFNETLTPTFSGSESWYYGSRAYLDTVTCDSLPAGLSYPQDGVANPNGTSPTYQITGTPEAGTEGVYNICFYTEDNPEGWVPLGNSQVVTITVTAAPVETSATSAGALSGTANAAFNEIVGYTSTGFAWSGTGTVSAVNLPAGIDLAVSGYDVDGSPILLASGAPTTAGSFTADITLTDGAQSASFDQNFVIAAAPSVVTASKATVAHGESVGITTTVPDANVAAIFVDGVLTNSGTVSNLLTNSPYAWAAFGGPVDAVVSFRVYGDATTGPVDAATAFAAKTDVTFSGYTAPVTYSVTSDTATVAHDGTVTITTDAPAENLAAIFVDGVMAGTTGTVAELTAANPFTWAHFGGTTDAVVSFRVYDMTTGTVDATTVAAGLVDVTFSGYVAPVTPAFTIGNNASFVNGTYKSSVVTITPNDGFDWTNGGTVSASGLPTGLSTNVPNPNTAGEVPTLQVSGTANATAGDYTVTVTLTDGASNSATATYTITVTDAVAARTISSTSTVVSYGESYTITTDAPGTGPISVFVDGVYFGHFAPGVYDWDSIAMTGSDSTVDHVISFRVYAAAYYNGNNPGAATSLVTTPYDNKVDVTIEGYTAPATAEYTFDSSDVAFDFGTGVGGDPATSITPAYSATGFDFTAGSGSIAPKEGQTLPVGITTTSTLGLNNKPVLRVSISRNANLVAGTYPIVFVLTDGENTAEQTLSIVLTEVKATPVVELGLSNPVGSNIADTGANYSATELQVESEWSLTLRSTPTVIASGIVGTDGTVSGTATIPAGLEAGWHSITFTGTDVNGNPVTSVTWFQIGADGTILAEQDTAPVTPEPVTPAEPALASTGANITGALGGGAALLALGALVMGFARRKEANN